MWSASSRSAPLRRSLSTRRARSRPSPNQPAADEVGPRPDDDDYYKRHGTTTLSAALNILDGTVIGRKHAALIGTKSSSASTIEAQVPCRKSDFT